MDSSQVGVLKERDEVSFSGFLKSHDGRGLEAKIGLKKKVMSQHESQVILGAEYLP
jgi:hypothetical protein